MKLARISCIQLLFLFVLAVGALALGSCAGGGSSTTAGIRIQGIVVNSNGDPLADVSVQESSLGNTAISDQTGNFFLETVFDARLTFSQAATNASLQLESVPETAAVITATFAVDFPTMMAVVVELEVVEERAPVPSPVPAEETKKPTIANATPIATAAPTDSPSRPPKDEPTVPPNSANTPTQPPAVLASVTPTATPIDAPTAPAPTATPQPTATVAVTYCSGDVNCDGVRTFMDIDCFSQLVSSGQGGPPSCPPQSQCPSMSIADINHDGVVNSTDVDAFVALLGVPCG